ncbi:MAG: conjugal transfer protein TrbJ [Caulobacteraceae bacterium]
MTDRLRLAARTLAAGACACVLGCATTASAQYEVFDPWTFQEQTLSFGQAVQQVSQGVTELTQLQNQLTAAQSAIQNLGSDNTSATLATVNQQAAQILQQAQGIGFNSASAGSAFATAYPGSTTVAGFNNAQLGSALSTWQTNSAQALQNAVTIQNQVAQNRAAISGAVSKAVTASNGAAGTTAATQATNQLLATVSAQLAQLQDILVTQGQAQAALAGTNQMAGAAAQATVTQTQQQTNKTLTSAPGVTNTSTL